MKSDSIFGGKYNEIVRLLAILVAMSHVCFPLAEWNIEFGCYLPLLNLVFLTSIRKPTNASIFWDLRVVFVQVFALFAVCAFFVGEASPFKISSLVSTTFRPHVKSSIFKERFASGSNPQVYIQPHPFTKETHRQPGFVFIAPLASGA